MKKNILIFAGLLLLLSSMGAIPEEPAEPAKTPDLEILNTQKWDDAFYKLVPQPTEDGNAATYFLRALHYRGLSGEEQEQWQGYPWLKDFNNDTRKSTKPEDIERVKNAIHMPELSYLVRGSLQRKYQIYGVHMMPSPEPHKTVFDQPIPEYISIMKMIYVLMARADSKLAAGDAAGANAVMMAAARVGHIMQKDVTLIGFMVGEAIELNVAKEMPEFCRKLKDEEKAKAWEDFVQLAEKHREESKNFMRFLNGTTNEELMKVTDNKTLPRSFRLGSLVNLIGNRALNHPLRATVFGVPDDVKEFITKDHFDDPEMIIMQLKIIEDAYVGVKAMLRSARGAK